MSLGLRPPVDEDASAVAELISEFAPDRIDAENVLRDWTSPVINREHDVRLEPGGYALVEDMTEGRVWLEFQGHPSPELVEWAEARGREVGTRWFSGAWSGNSTILELLHVRGFEVTRHSHRMEVELDHATTPVVWPKGTTVRTLRGGDEQTFYEVHQETFEDTWEPIRETFEEWSHWLLQGTDFAPDLWFLVHAGDEPAAFAICNPYPTRPELGWSRLLGVRRPWRRQGLGRALLLHTFGELSNRGMRHAGLGVDATSLTGANTLYESVGMRVKARFDIHEKDGG